MVGQRYGGGRPSAEDALAATLTNDVVETGRASKNQLAKLFRVDKNNISRLLDGLSPVSKKAGVDLYDVKDAATMLVPPGYEIEDRIKRMNRADIPSGLAAEFWAGQKGRLSFEILQGDHWPTADVEAHLSEAFAACRMQLMLMRDRVERETSLTVQQRSIIERAVEATINGMKKALVDGFADRPAPVDNIAGASPSDL